MNRLHHVDGWYTHDLTDFHFHTKDAAGWTYRAQLAVDVRGWKPWLWWCTGVVSIAAGVAREYPPLIFMGLAWGLAYVHMLRTIVRGYRRTVLIDGIVNAFDRRHPLLRSALAGELHHTNEAVRERVMAVLPVWAAKSYAGPDGSLRVLVAHSPRAEYSPVIGLRPESRAVTPEGCTAAT